MASEFRTTAAPTGSSRRKNSFRQVDTVWSAALRLPRARWREVRLEQADTSPTAVRDMITEYTGMMS